MELPVGLRDSPKEFVRLLNDLNTEHPYRSEEEDAEADQHDRHAPVDRYSGVFAQPRACASKQNGQQDSGKYQEQNLEGIGDRQDQANDDSCQKHTLAKP